MLAVFFLLLFFSEKISKFVENVVRRIILWCVLRPFNGTYKY